MHMSTVGRDALQTNAVTFGLMETMQQYAADNRRDMQEKVAALQTNYDRNTLIEGTFSTATDLFGTCLCFTGTIRGAKVNIRVSL